MTELRKTDDSHLRESSIFQSTGPIVRPMMATSLLPSWSGRQCELGVFPHSVFDIYKRKTSDRLFELVAIWVGADPIQLCQLESVSEWAKELQDAPVTPKSWLAHLYVRSLELALRALIDGELRIDGEPSPCIEESYVKVERFSEWATSVHLPRAAITEEGDASDPDLEAYSNPTLEVIQMVVYLHYRFKSHGGPYDPEDPSTHPHPDEVKRTIRRLGVTVHAQVELIYRVVRDPRIPYGRRAINRVS